MSRQRTWGVPIPLFVHKSSGEPHPRTAELIEQVARASSRKGIDAWFELKAEEMLGAEAADYDKISDTLDVWFDSGVTHATVLERNAGSGFSGGSVSGRLGPASRLVPIIVAVVCGDAWNARRTKRC